MDERPGGMSWDKALSDETLGDQPNTDAAGLKTASGVGTATGGDATDDPEEIRAQIEATRAGMSQTIDAIQERLSPENLKEQAKEQVDMLTEHAKERVEEIADQAQDKLKETVQETVQTAKNAVYDATIGKAGEAMQNVGETVSDAAQQVGTTIRDAGSSVVRTVRTNPLPFALMGLGLGMLLLRRNRPRYDRYEDYNGGADWGYERGRTAGQGQARGVQSRTQSEAGGVIGSAQETISKAASGAVGTVSNAAGQAKDHVSNLASQTADRVSNLGSQIQQGAQRVQVQYQQSLQENPLAVGAVALAAGAAVGLMLPSTRMEDRWMGETKENLTQKAEQAARDTIEKVQQVAGQAGRAAREEAEYQGLTG